MPQAVPSPFSQPGPFASPSADLSLSPPREEERRVRVAVGLDDPLLLLLVGGPPRLAADIERLLVTRIGLTIGLVTVTNSAEAISRAAGGGFDGIVVFDDQVGRSTLRSLRDLQLRLATLCVLERVEPSMRATMRADMRHEGAMGCLFAEELSGPLLEFAVLHAVETSRVRASSSGDARRDALHRIAAAQARMKAERDVRFSVVHLDLPALTAGKLGEGVTKALERAFESTMATELGGDVLLRLGRGGYVIVVETLRFESSPLESLERIRDLVRRPLSHEGQHYSLDVGLGVVAGNAEACAEQLLGRALEASKARSPGPRPGDVAWMSGEYPRTDVPDAHRRGAALQRALDEGSLALCYQPIVGLDTRHLVGFEALLRLEDTPGRQMVEARDFIGDAEESALIVPMGYWALETAIRQMTQWDREFELGGCVAISVNLSTCQCADPTLLARIRSLLMTTGCDPAAIRVEIGHEALALEPKRTRMLIGGLAESGIGVWIEDFGVDPSSVDDLRGLPIAALKIDQALVHGLDGTPATTRRIKHVVDAASSLGVAVMAEGVETETQANVLRMLGCSVGQGYWYARPLAVGDAYAYLAAQSNR